MTSRFRLGFMLRIPTVAADCPNGPREVFRDALALAVSAEALGFDSLWVTQHHFGAVDSSLPSPFVFLAAVASRTTKIRLGTTVVTAPLEHPIRLAEDAATLDVLSEGRVEVGLGTTSSALELAAFGVSADMQRESLHATARAVADAFNGRGWAGLPAAVIHPQTCGLATRMWLATATKAHATFAGDHGFGLITNFRPSSLSEENRGYIDAHAEASRQAGVAPRLALSRGVFPTTDRATARRILMPHAARFIERGQAAGWLPPSFGIDDYFSREDFHYGHPDDVAASLSTDQSLSHATDLLTGMLSARLSPRELMPAMEHIAARVAPALGWRPRAT